MDQGSSGSFLSLPYTASHIMHIFTVLELLNGVRWLAGGWVAQVTWLLEAQSEQVEEPRVLTRCRLLLLDQILGLG